MKSVGTKGPARAGTSQMVVYAAGELASRAISFLLLPVYTQKLMPADYGTLQLIMLVFEVVGVLGITRVASGLFRYYALQTDARSQQSYVSSAFAIVNASHLVVATVVFLLADALAVEFLTSASEAGLLRIGAAMFAVQGLVSIPAAYQRLLGNPWGYVRQVVGVQILQASFNILFVVVLGYGVKGVLLSGVLAYSIIGTTVAIGMIRRTGWLASTVAMKELVGFALPLTVGAIALLIIMMGGRYALKEYATVAEVGLYALAVTFGGVMFQLGASPFLQFWEAQRFRIADAPDRDEQYARDFVRFNVSLLAVGTAIGVFVRDYLLLAASPAYWPVAALVPIALVAYLLQGWTSVLDTGVLLSGRTGAIARTNWIGAIVAVFGYLFVVPRLGAAGAVLTLVLSFATRCGLVALASHKAVKISWRWRPVLLLLAASAATVAAAYAVPSSAPLLSLSSHALLLAVFLWFATSRYILGSEDSRRLVGTVYGAITDPAAFIRGVAK